VVGVGADAPARVARRRAVEGRVRSAQVFPSPSAHRPPDPRCHVTETAAPLAGEPGPVLDLPTLTGGRVDTTSWDGHPVLVSFLRHAG
jgi:hypothetical protein